jgi:hypothetical protein
MITAIYLLGVFAALFINITALTVLVHRFLPLPATARAVGLLALCTSLFSLEHFIGLGDLSVALLPTTAAAVFVLLRARRDETSHAVWQSQIVFLGAFLFSLLCRLASPDIVEDNDRLTDIHLVANYMSGMRLPPLDYWFPSQNFDYYYAFQQYCAALLGRFLAIGPGASFNLAAILIGSLVLTLAWEFLSALQLGLGRKLFCIAALAIGGTGVSPFFHLVTAPSKEDLYTFGSAIHAVFYNSRFVGWFSNDTASPLWRSLFGDGTERAVLLPIETFGNQFAIGGFHAPLSGFLLLFLALTIMVSLPTSQERYRPRLEAVLGFTVPLVIVSNAWVFPFQAALIGGWKLWDWGLNGRREVIPLLAGAGAGTILLLPALAGMAAETGYARTALVSAEARTPVAQFLLMHWPLILLAAFLPLAGLARSLGTYFGVAFLVLLLFGEIFNVTDDGYVGDFVRFNPALKWWGWIFTGGVFTTSAFLLAGERRPFRWAAVITLVLVSTFVFDVGRLVAVRFAASSHDLSGEAYYTSDPANARIIEYLSDAPWGIVLEKVYDKPPIDTGIYGSLAQKPDLVGIPWVLRVWQRNLPDLQHVVANVERFYGGTINDPTIFLTEQNVRYVVWSTREAGDMLIWESINLAIAREYRWIEFSSDPQRHVGLWERRSLSSQEPRARRR